MNASPLDTVIAEIPKNSRETYRIRLGEYKGHVFCDLRLWYSTEGDKKPSAKGIAIKPDALPAVIAALQDAQKRLAGVS